MWPQYKQKNARMPFTLVGRYKEENEGLLQAGRGFLTP